MSTGILSSGADSNPYITPDPYAAPNAGTFTGAPGTGVFEITLTTSLATVALPVYSGTTNLRNAETYNGAIPGPTFTLTVNDTVIVRLINNLPYPTGIHWHGIELANSADGTEVTQKDVPGGTIQTLGNGVPAGGTYLYKFKVTRPGIYWYHPHHGNSSTRLFRGLYGMIVVKDLNEETLVTPPLGPNNTLPSVANTKQIVLSDITVCKTPGSNTPYDLTLPWAGPGGVLPVQPGSTPATLCELPGAVDENGTPLPPGSSYADGNIPSLMGSGRINEGNTVLTNGVNVGARAGSPSAPGIVPLDATTHRLPVLSGQGLRLQILNCATHRYFRLRLTYHDGVTGQQLNLVQVGGEGGVLDRAVLEGGVISGFDTKYDSGEILLAPSTRADVVVVIPAGLAVNTVLTLWTLDFPRLGFSAQGTGPWVKIPTVPVMHLQVTGAVAAGTEYAIVGGVNGVGGTPLRAKVGFPGPLVAALGGANGSLLTPAGGFVAPKFGMLSPDIKLTAGVPSIDGTDGGPLHGHPNPPNPPYPNTLHIASSRYAEAVAGRILELTVTNMTNAHHPFHLHGFSMQPKSLAPRATPPALPVAPEVPTTGTFPWLYQEFRDSINVPAHYTLTFRVKLDDRPLVDGVTLGGWLGRWFFHCHIFFHHHRGMIGEFVVTNANGKERPYVDVGGSWAYAPSGGTTTRQGTFSSPKDGSLPVALAATYGTAGGPIIGTAGPVVVTLAPVGTTAGRWSWTSPVLGDGIYYVYITATDSLGLQGQAVFRLKIGIVGGINDDGSDTGDPHIRTVDGKSYDFQAVGEFTLLRDRESSLEIQTRQAPWSANPITDGYSGLAASPSVNIAIAARVGSHRISYQPSEQGGNSPLQFFLDGKPTDIPTEGIDLEGHIVRPDDNAHKHNDLLPERINREGHRVTSLNANGEMGFRVDYAHGAVLIVTSRLFHIRILDIWVSHTQADEGIMGSIPKNTWLPTLPNGATVGPMPPEKDLHARYIALYKTFADAWRVTDETSLFVYTRGTSTATFTDKDWPAETPPSILKPQFKIPGFLPLENIPIAKAKRICRGVTIKDLHDNCVFDVQTTGDERFAKGYLIAQELRLCGSAVQIVGDKPQTRPGGKLVVTATVLPLTPKRPVPTGSVTFIIDGVPVKGRKKLDKLGRAKITITKLKVGEHKIRAEFTPADVTCCHSSSSPNLLHPVTKGHVPTGGHPTGGHPTGGHHTGGMPMTGMVKRAKKTAMKKPRKR